MSTKIPIVQVPIADSITGVPIEEMDKLFGGNSGEADLRRIAEIRARLGVTADGHLDAVVKEAKGDSTAHIESVSSKE